MNVAQLSVQEITQLSEQEIFNAVVARLRDGTGRALDGQGHCTYFDQDTGMKCAVGIFMPDGSPLQSFQGSLGSLEYDYPDDVFVRDFVTPNKWLLSRLQDAHDQFFGDEKNFLGEEELELIASAHGLAYAIKTSV